MKRTLTHNLIHDQWDNRWKCECGYTLGDGHAALYAPCPLSAAPITYPEVRTTKKKGKPNDSKRRSSKGSNRKTVR